MRRVPIRPLGIAFALVTLVACGPGAPVTTGSLSSHQSPVQQSPVQQSPVQQSPVQQSPVQQSPVQQGEVASDTVSVRIVRTSYQTRPVELNVTNPGTVKLLTDDVLNLPPLPKGAFACPADIGPQYRLTFTTERNTSWVANFDTGGCATVRLSDGRVLWAMRSPNLSRDLQQVMGRAGLPIMPGPCSPPPALQCYAGPTPIPQQ